MQRICTIIGGKRAGGFDMFTVRAKWPRYSVLAIAALFAVAAAEQRATTSDGKAVILKEDGTWRYVTQSDRLADKLGQSNGGNQENGAGSGAGGGAGSGAGSNMYDLTAGGGADGGGYSVNNRQQEASDEPQRTALVDVIKGDRAFDVRKARWGMTRQEVKKSENLQLLSDKNDVIEYKFMLLGIKSRIRYRFQEDRLAGAEYVIEQDDVNPSRFYDDFKALRGFLRQLYNAPVSDEKVWTNDIYKADEKNWGFAISLGFLTCKTSWQNATTRIYLAQTGGNHLINTSIQYAIRPK
jgi:hypothetical protein